MTGHSRLCVQQRADGDFHLSHTHVHALTCTREGERSVWGIKTARWSGWSQRPRRFLLGVFSEV